MQGRVSRRGIEAGPPVDRATGHDVDMVARDVNVPWLLKLEPRKKTGSLYGPAPNPVKLVRDDPPVSPGGPSMADARTCPDCGSELPARAPEGLCPRCLLGAGWTATP